MAAAVYVVTTTNIPNSQLRVSRAEYEYLIELELLDELVQVIAPTADIVVQTTAPVDPPIGLLWANPTVPA